jgi:hypothetical protein
MKSTPGGGSAEGGAGGTAAVAGRPAVGVVAHPARGGTQSTRPSMKQRAKPERLGAKT